jgi:hypothetical protein
LFAPSVIWKQKGFTFMQRKLILEANRLQLETEGATNTDLASNRNAWLQRYLAERPSISMLWLSFRLATLWLAVLMVGFAISFYVLPYGLIWFVGLLY